MGVALETIDMVEGLNQHILEVILSIFAVPEHVEGQSVDLAGVAANQFCKASSSRLCFGDQDTFGSIEWGLHCEFGSQCRDVYELLRLYV